VLLTDVLQPELGRQWDGLSIDSEIIGVFLFMGQRYGQADRPDWRLRVGRAADHVLFRQVALSPTALGSETKRAYKTDASLCSPAAGHNPGPDSAGRCV
jgi:hypothetical protein